MHSSAAHGHGQDAHGTHGQDAHGTGKRPGAAKRQRGVALLLVLVIVGALTTLGLAAIAAATLTTRAGENFAAHAAALQAAQSGVEVAASRISRPWEVGLTWGESWTGTQGYEAMPQSGNGPGRCDSYYRIVTREEDDRILVTSTGLAVSPGGSPTREEDVQARSTVTAVYSRPKLEVPYAALSGGLMLVPSKMKINGNAFSNGDLWVWFGGQISGNAWSTGSIVNFGSVTGSRITGMAKVGMPPISIDCYWPHYDYNGVPASPVRLTLSATGVLPTGVPGNRDNIYYTDSASFTLKEASLNGTLLVRGDLVISNTVVIDAKPGMPALIVEGDLVLLNNAQLTTNGLVQVSGQVRGTGTNTAQGAKWTHNGPLVFDGSGALAMNLQATVTVNYRIDRTVLQPVAEMTLKTDLLRYSETE